MWGFFLGLLVAGSVAWVFVQYFRQNARMLVEEKQRLEQEKTLVLEFMHNLVEGVGEESSRRELHARIIHAAVLGTGAVSGCLYVPAGEGKLRGAAVEGLFPPQKPMDPKTRESLGTRAEFLRKTLEAEEIAHGEGIVGEVAGKGEPILVNDADSDPRVTRHDDPVLRVRSLLAVPMFFRKRFLGVIAVANSADGAGFSETDHSLVVSLGEQAALAIHNADQVHSQMEKHRLDLDLSLAANVQGMLLPAVLPRLPGLEVAAVYQTAQRVGGDMYNVFELPGGKVGVAIADVSGKGVAASLLMAICQTSLGHLARGGDPPREVLLRMNAEILGEIRADMFVTMIYAVIDPGTRSLRLARAGHELPVLCTARSDGRPGCRTIVSEGMAIGMAPEPIFGPALEEIELPFGPGDVLVLYTDGITERTNSDGAEFGTARLADTVGTAVGRSAEGIKEAILSAVDRFGQEGSPSDDMTLLVVKARDEEPKAN